MNELTALELGAIYKTDWDSRPFRVIGFDEVEVFYDCLWSDNRWMFTGNFKKKVFFYRTHSKHFLKRSQKIASMPFTEEEFNAFRPDLPIKIGRTMELSWNDFQSSSQDDLMSYFDNNVNKVLLGQKLQAEKISLLPYGTKGGLKKGSTILADNLEFFTIIELLWKAKKIQEAVNAEISKGIGIYRIGFEKSMPSYYIGEYLMAY